MSTAKTVAFDGAETAVVLSAPASTRPSDISQGYTSITGTDFETRKRVFAAVSAAVPLNEHLGEAISVVDILVQPVESEDEDTGEVQEYLRSTLIAADGVAYSAGSKGVSMAINNMLSIFGEPNTWPEGGIAIQVVEKKGKKGKFFSVELA